MAKERNLLKIIFTNFINSLKPRQFKGNLKGVDKFGNKYYEILPGAESGHSRRSRWFDPAIKDNFDEEKPAEWESWLRGRRREPPTEEEISKNLEISDMKKVNAAELALKHNIPEAKQHAEMKDFPTYEEYEKVPSGLSSKPKK